MASALVLAGTLVVAIGASQPTQAWSETGHIAIAELAMRGLSGEKRNWVNGIAAMLARQNDETDELQARYGELSPLALTASWLDGLRGRTVEDIFKEYGDRVPPELAPYANSTTDDWHYSNRLWHEHEEVMAEPCSDLGGRLNQIIPRLQDAFSSAADRRDKAIVLAMLVHLVADAHQPLHGIARVTDHCRHDRGGNAFCVDRSGGGRCERNLHQLWDAGFGVFQRDIEKTLDMLVLDSDPAALDSKPRALQPRVWQTENFLLARAVYNTKENRRPSAQYRRHAQSIVRQRANLAAGRLMIMLSELTLGMSSGVGQDKAASREAATR